jgi:8-oxo-dGTP pyrophosphatase MutT (NUDIX family)
MYDFDFFKVKWLSRYGWVLDRSTAVVIVPIAPDDRIWLAKHVRPPTGTCSWELVGGAIDRNEDPISAGLRELEEESGLVARGGARLLSKAIELAPGMGKFPHRVVIAKNVVPRGRRPAPQREEGIVAVRRFDRAGVRRMIRRGSISVGGTLAALLASGWMEGQALM